MISPKYKSWMASSQGSELTFMGLVNDLAGFQRINRTTIETLPHQQVSTNSVGRAWSKRNVFHGHPRDAGQSRATRCWPL